MKTKTAESTVQDPAVLALGLLREMEKWGLLSPRATDGMRLMDLKVRAKKLLKSQADES